MLPIPAKKLKASKRSNLLPYPEPLLNKLFYDLWCTLLSYGTALAVEHHNPKEQTLSHQVKRRVLPVEVQT